METRFPNLFSPISVNSMELKNRIVMSAMHLGYTPEGEVTDRLVDFYGLRAKGGVGLIVVGGCPVDEYGGMASMIAMYDDRFIPGLSRLTFTVKTEGAKIAAQLYQAGRYTHSAMIGGKKPFSASAVRSRFTGETPRALELEEIPGVQDRFAEAAVRAKKAGFDAVEILASAGYLISQFLSPLTNLRDDEYGGSFENRMRFGREVAMKVRQAVGPDYPVLMRIAGNDFMDGSNTNRESRLFAAEMEKTGVDLFNVTGGWHETRIPQISTFVPRKAYTYLAQGIKSAVSVPVLASNRVNDPRAAEEILRHGEADLVTMARGLIADPFLPQKAEEGRPGRIYRCIACNQGCFDAIFSMRPAGCLVNPLAGREGEITVTPADKAKRLLVVGGGPAGMKAAVTAAERGHAVTLVEKGPRLGGQLLLNRSIPGRGEMVTAAEDLAANLEPSGVDVRLGLEMGRADVKAFAPDAVIVATGASPIQPDIPGVGGDNVVSAWDLLEKDVTLGKRVVIVGGNALGLEIALFAAQQGTLSPEVLHFLAANRAESWETLENLIDRGNKEVTVLEMESKAGQDIGPSTRWTVLAEIRRLGVQVITEAKAVEFTGQGVEIEKNGESRLVPADSIVLAMGSGPVNRLAGELEGKVPELYTIGDAREPRNALEAIREGFTAGLEV
ncbi:MAG: FAD-dependent oxidoreductase [Desulfatiglandales bacterium]